MKKLKSETVEMFMFSEATEEFAELIAEIKEENKSSDDEYKRADDAKSFLEVMVHCPYCNHYQDIIDNVRESLGEDLTVTGIEHEITCEECGQIFIVDNVQY